MLRAIIRPAVLQSPTRVRDREGVRVALHADRRSSTTPRHTTSG